VLHNKNHIELIMKNYLFKIKVAPYAYECSAIESFKTLNIMYLQLYFLDNRNKL